MYKSDIYHTDNTDESCRLTSSNSFNSSVLLYKGVCRNLSRIFKDECECDRGLGVEGERCPGTREWMRLRIQMSKSRQ